MSVCISQHGEFSSHKLDMLHTCSLCGVLDEDALRAELVRVTAERDQLRAVWVLSYLNPSDEHDNGVLGVYTSEPSALHAGVAKAIEADPNLVGKNVFWQGDTLMVRTREQTYPVRVCYSVDRWEVSGS